MCIHYTCTEGTILYVRVHQQSIVVHSVMCIHYTCTEGTCTSALYGSVQCDAYTCTCTFMHA